MTNPFDILEERLIRIEHLLNDLKLTVQRQNAQEESRELLSAKQAAALLNIALPTLYGYTSRMEIPVSKKGKQLYFSKKEILSLNRLCFSKWVLIILFLESNELLQFWKWNRIFLEWREEKFNPICQLKNYNWLKALPMMPW